MSGEVAVEIFAKNFVGAAADTLTQGFADTDTFSRHPDSHVVPQSSMIVTDGRNAALGGLVTWGA